MTTIAAVLGDGWAAMACDSRGREGAHVMDGVDKGHKLGGALVGTAGLSLADEAVRSFDGPLLAPRCSFADARLWSEMLAAHVRRVVLEAGHGHKLGPYLETGCSVLVATRVGIFVDCGDGGVVHRPDDYWAIGSGAGLALGAIASRRDLDPHGRAANAVRVAGMHDSETGGEVVLYELEPLP